MTRTSTELEQEFLSNLQERTGKNLDEWLRVLRHSKRVNRNELLALLKERLGWGHLPAQLLVGIFLNDGKPVYGPRENLDTQTSNDAINKS